MNTYLTFSDFRGFGRLALQATRGITDLVEEMHTTISTPYGIVAPSTPGRARGITGLVYRSIHGGYSLLGGAVDITLGLLSTVFDEPSSSAERDAVLALVNGICGDYLAASHNPLAIEMSLRYNGQSLTLQRGGIQEAIPQAGDKLVVLVHGLCMNDLGWSRAEHDHGAALARDLGYTPVYLRYNSGLHISTNGRSFAGLLERLVEEWPHPVKELVIIGHSMGGLVARSACEYGALAGQGWPKHLSGLVCLGTPHHGTPLERIGNWIGGLSNVSRYTAPFRRLGTYRSAGITDLRYGNLVDEDWEGLDRFGLGPDERRHVPIPDGVRCYTIGAALGCVPGDVRGRLLGDGMVPLDSALGRHEDPQRCLAYPESCGWVGYGMDHLDLLDREEVYGKIVEWLGGP